MVQPSSQEIHDALARSNGDHKGAARLLHAAAQGMSRPLASARARATTLQVRAAAPFYGKYRGANELLAYRDRSGDAESLDSPSDEGMEHVVYGPPNADGTWPETWAGIFEIFSEASKDEPGEVWIKFINEENGDPEVVTITEDMLFKAPEAGPRRKFFPYSPGLQGPRVHLPDPDEDYYPKYGQVVWGKRGFTKSTRKTAAMFRDDLDAEAWYKPKDVMRRGVTRWLTKDKLKAADAKVRAMKREVKLADAYDDPERQREARRNLEAARAEREQLIDDTTRVAMELAAEG